MSHINNLSCTPLARGITYHWPRWSGDPQLSNRESRLSWQGVLSLLLWLRQQIDIGDIMHPSNITKLNISYSFQVKDRLFSKNSPMVNEICNFFILNRIVMYTLGLSYTMYISPISICYP